MVVLAGRSVQRTLCGGPPSSITGQWAIGALRFRTRDPMGFLGFWLPQSAAEGRSGALRKQKAGREG